MIRILIALAGLLAAATMEARAHHPGSHASRDKDGRVRLEVAAMVADSCTRIDTVALGAPPNVRAAGVPVTVRLRRPREAVCAQVVGVAKQEVVLEVPAGTSGLHLYILGPDGIVVGTERVPIR